MCKVVSYSLWGMSSNWFASAATASKGINSARGVMLPLSAIALPTSQAREQTQHSRSYI